MPSHLKPASEQAQAEEIANLAGGAAKLMARADELAAAGDFRLACHLADWAYLSGLGDAGMRKGRERIYAQRARAETSTMAIGIYLATAREMGEGLEDQALDKPIIQGQSERGKQRSKPE
jgi:alkyl sulfatase BDS1-like metallo-beta-lactamase superfamily hydrolase